MGIFKKKQKAPTLYEVESTRIREELAGVKPGTDEYEKLMNELVKLQAFVGKQKDIDRKMSDASITGLCGIAGKVVGFLGLGGLAWGISHYEKTGHIFTGQNNGLISNIVKIGSRFYG